MSSTALIIHVAFAFVSASATRHLEAIEVGAGKVWDAWTPWAGVQEEGRGLDPKYGKDNSWCTTVIKCNMFNNQPWRNVNTQECRSADKCMKIRAPREFCHVELTTDKKHIWGCIPDRRAACHQHGSLQGKVNNAKAKKGDLDGFKIGDLVKWNEADADIPAGHIGEVIDFVYDPEQLYHDKLAAKVRVNFPKLKYSVLGQKLTKVGSLSEQSVQSLCFSSAKFATARNAVAGMAGDKCKCPGDLRVTGDEKGNPVCRNEAFDARTFDSEKLKGKGCRCA